MVVEIDPDGTLDPALGVAMRIPESGRLAVNVRAVPPFDLTVIPFIWTGDPDESIVDLVDAMAADPVNHPMFGPTRRLLPIDDLWVTAHVPVESSSDDIYKLLAETQAIRAIEGGTGHYMGMMSQVDGPFAGLANRPGRSSFSIPSSETVAHELGHNLGLFHAPCGDPRGVDPAYPYRNGNIGAWGYDSRNGGRLVRPSIPDLMSYCEADGDPLTWTSDYNFTNALRFRVSDADSVGLPDRVTSAQGLLLWGGVDPDGLPFMEPAFVVHAPSALPDSTGPFGIIGRNSSGNELFSLDFTMPEVADGDGSSSFAFVLPARPHWEGDLASITLTGPSGSATLDGESNIPMAILRNLRSGRVRGILRGPAASQVAADAGAASASGLQMLISRGIPSVDAWKP